MSIRMAVVLLVSALIFDAAIARGGQELGGSGSWQSLSGDAIRGRWTVSLTRDGDLVEGNLQLDGSNVFTGGRVSGTITESEIVLGIVEEGAKQATFAGKLSGGKVSGEWESSTIGDSGVWHGSFVKPESSQR